MIRFVRNGKKAMFYTLAAILVLGLLLSLWSLHSVPKLSTSITRVESLNAFVKNLATDASMACYVSGFRGLISLTEEVEQSGNYISDVNQTLNELMRIGTLSGVPSTLMINNTLQDWISKMEQKATVMTTILTITVDTIQVSQSDPWFVDIHVNITLNLSDSISKSRWDTKISTNSSIPIEGLTVPLLIVETANKFTRSINKTIYANEFVVGANSGNLTNHMIKGYFVATPLAPSYLMRMEGLAGNSPHGIESLIDKTALATQMIIHPERSNVDHIYFWAGLTPSYDITIVADPFRLDNISNPNVSRLQFYNVSGYAIP